MSVLNIAPAKSLVKTGRILVIEDNKTSRHYLVKILQHEGYTAEEAADAYQGFEKLHQQSFDLVLLDVNLPGMSGFDLCRKLKQDSALNNIPVIFLTSSSDEDSVAKGFELGANDYLTKPYLELELFARVNTHIKLKKSIELCNQKHKETSESEKKFRNLFLKAPIMLLLVDSAWRIKQPNQLFLEYTGFSKQEVTERHLEDFLHGLQMKDLLTNAFAIPPKENKSYLHTQSGINLEVRINTTLHIEQGEKYHILALEILSDHHTLLPQIQTNAEKYKQLFSTSGDGILILDSKGYIADANPAACNLFECNRALLTGKKISTLSAEKNKDALIKLQQQVDKGARGNWHTVELKSPSGKIISAEANLVFVDLPGESGYFLILHDIINRKSFLEKIAVFNRLAETSGQGLALIRPAGAIYYMNPSLQQLLNLTNQKTSLEQLKWDRFLPENLQSYFRNIILPIVRKEEKWAGNFTIKSLGNLTIQVYLNISLIRNVDDQPHLIAISVTDMREAHAAEEQRKMLEQRFRAFAASLPQTLFELDTTGKLLYVNEFGLKHFGFSPDIISTGINVSDILYPEDIPVFEKQLEKLINEDPEKENLEYRFLTKNGSTIHGKVHARYFDNKDKKGIIQGLMIDTTSNKKMLETIQQYNHDLKKLNATKDRFFSILAHDLKNPFTTIIGFSELMVRKTGTENFDVAQIHMYAKELMKAANNSYNLVENLLDWSHSQRGKLIVNPEMLTIADIVEENLKLFSSTADNKEIKFIPNVNNSLQVYADYNTLNTVIRNLLSNAIKFSFPGGRIYINAIQKADKTTISIADRGKGIPRENIKKLFKVDAPITTEGTQNERGTGLGLVICKEFIEKNNGKISVDSRENKGSIFTIILPAKDNQAN